jgi:type IV pilus assembly protein PilQ
MRTLAILLLAFSLAPGAPAAERWVGKPITLKAARVPVVDLLRLIGEASGFNLVISDGVAGEMSAISWEAVPWDQALDVILKSKRLRAVRSGSVLRIMTHGEYMTESGD